MQGTFGYAARARPLLPRPTCRVMLVCGPPAAGKSTLVASRAATTDLIIDLDLIAREYGFSRDRPNSAASVLLDERNQRLAALAKEPPGRTAWVILSAPSRALRQWWRDALGVRDENMIVLIPSRHELRERIRRDVDRRYVVEKHFTLVDEWLAREAANNPGLLSGEVNKAGFPSDPLHPWNRTSK